MKFDLNKSAQALSLSLAKHGIITPPSMELAFNLDVSGSFDDEHKSGLTQALLTRLVPWGMVFDPDKKMDVFTFSAGESGAYRVGDITPDTCEGYIPRHIINQVPGYGYSTDYYHVLRKNLNHFGYMQPSVASGSGGGMFSKLFGSNKAPTATTAPKKRALILHVTDGDNNPGDKEPTRRLLRESQDRGDLVYFLFIGCSNQPGTFDYIADLGNKFNNVGLVTISDIKRFSELPDDEVNTLLIGDELVNWLKT